MLFSTQERSDLLETKSQKQRHWWEEKFFLLCKTVSYLPNFLGSIYCTYFTNRHMIWIFLCMVKMQLISQQGYQRNLSVSFKSKQCVLTTCFGSGCNGAHSSRSPHGAVLCICGWNCIDNTQMSWLLLSACCTALRFLPPSLSPVPQNMEILLFHTKFIATQEKSSENC